MATTDSGIPPATYPTEASGSRVAVRVIAIGAVCGIAWACGLRGFMAQVTTGRSMVTWSGTFLLILLPGLAVGGMLGYAEHVRRTTQLPHARWLVWAPMVLAIGVGIDVVMRGPTVEQGLGQIIGGVVISALPVSGAYAIAGHRKWLRVVCAALALSPIPLWILKATDIGGPSLGLTEPKGAWVAIYLWSFVAVIVIATTIPLRIPPRRP